jgi:DNA-binding transcriptional MerR regulator
MPIREISRRTGLSRHTIRKYLREGAVEPKFKTPSRPSKLDPYADRLSAWLLAQLRRRGIRHPRMGRLVKHPPPAGTHRKHPAAEAEANFYAALETETMAA